MFRRRHGSWCDGDSVGPGLAVRLGRSGRADDASEERTGLALFGVDALLRARSLLSVARTVPGPDHLGPLCRWLATSLRLPPPTHNSARHCRLGWTSGSKLRNADSRLPTQLSPDLHSELQSERTRELHSELTPELHLSSTLWTPTLNSS